MRIKQQQIEKLARVVIAKPLACVIRLARAIALGATWLIRRRKAVTWAK